MRGDDRARLQDRFHDPLPLGAADEAQVRADVRPAALDLVALVAAGELRVLEDAPAGLRVGRAFEVLEPRRGVLRGRAGSCRSACRGRGRNGRQSALSFTAESQLAPAGRRVSPRRARAVPRAAASRRAGRRVRSCHRRRLAFIAERVTTACARTATVASHPSDDVTHGGGGLRVAAVLERPQHLDRGTPDRLASTIR